MGVLIYSKSAQADWTELICIKNQTGHTLELAFNEATKQVNTRGVIRDADFDKEFIFFEIPFDGGKYLFTVDRSTGLMTVFNTKEKNRPPIYECNALNKKRF